MKKSWHVKSRTSSIWIVLLLLTHRGGNIPRFKSHRYLHTYRTTRLFARFIFVVCVKRHERTQTHRVKVCWLVRSVTVLFRFVSNFRLKEKCCLYLLLHRFCASEATFVDERIFLKNFFFDENEKLFFSFCHPYKQISDRVTAIL